MTPNPPSCVAPAARSTWRDHYFKLATPLTIYLIANLNLRGFNLYTLYSATTGCIKEPLEIDYIVII